MPKGDAISPTSMEPVRHPSLLAYVQAGSMGARHIILLDPDDQTPEVAAARAVAAVSAGSRMVFVGGSTGTDDDNVHATVLAVQEALELCAWNASQDSGLSEDDWKVPVVLFPAGAHALSPLADGITFMMLMNSLDRRFIINEQVTAALPLKEAGVSPLSMGYLVCAPGGAVGEVGKADLFHADDTDRVREYAACAEYFGFDLLYLEAGSGADTPISSNLIQAAREACDLTLLVGGGIRDGQAARRAVQAGADWVVTGSLTEEFDDPDELQRTLSEFITSMRST